MKNSKASVIIPLMPGTFMAALDNSIVNVSLPVMQKQFKVQIDDIQWVITAYMLAFCVFMPLTNWLIICSYYSICYMARFCASQKSIVDYCFCFVS